MNYVELYPGDYMRATADLSLIEHGAYLQLLLHYYGTEKPLPNDNQAVFRIARAMTNEEQNAVLSIIDRFFPVNPKTGLRHNERADRQIAQAIEKIEKYRANGRKGGRPAKGNANQADNPNETNGLSETKPNGKANQKPTNTNTISNKSGENSPNDFRAQLFASWKSLPNGGGGAFLNKLLRDYKPEQRVLEAVEYTLDDTRADPKAFVIGVLRKDDREADELDEILAGAV